MDKNTGFHPYGQFVEAAFPESDRDIVPLTFKDGSTTYHYRGNEYLTEEEAITARDGPSWGKKAVEFAGKTLMSSPTINTIVNKAGPVVGKVLGNQTVQDALSLPGEETIAGAVGDSFVKYGYPRILGETGTYLAYPGPENPTNFTDAARILDATSDGRKLVDIDGTILRNSDGAINENAFAIKGGGYSYRKGRGLNNPIWDNLPEKTQKKFTEAGIDSDKAKFFIEKWTREVGAEVEGYPYTDATFEFMKGELLPRILEDMKGINLSDGLQLDHIAQLKALTPFYKGRNLKQAKKIRRILIKEGIFGGHNPKNLKYLPTDVHTVKTRFWEQQVGKDGSKFFKGRPMRTYADVENAAKEMKVFIDRSNDIVEKVSSQYYLMRKNKISPQELDSILQKVDLNQDSYNLKEVQTLINEISIDTKTLGGYTGQNTIFSQIVSDNISDLVKFTENNIRGEEALLDVIFKKVSPAAALKKYRKFDPTMTQGTFNKYLRQARQKDVMEQLRNLRRGKSMKLDEQTGIRPDD